MNDNIITHTYVYIILVSRINAHVTRHRNNLSSKLHAYSYIVRDARHRVHALPVISSRGGGCRRRVRCYDRDSPSIRVGHAVYRGAGGGARASVVVMSEQQPSRVSSSRQRITSALQVIRKNSVYRSIVMRLGHAADTPKKCKKSLAMLQPDAAAAGASPADDGGFGDWRTEGLPEHSHRRPSPPCAVSRSASDYGVVRSSVRKQHVSDTKRVEEAYRRGFCDGSAADVFLIRQTAAVQQQPTASGRRRRPSSVDYADSSPWTRLSSSSTVPAGLGCGGGGGDRVPSKSRVITTPTAAATVVVQHRSLPSASRFQRHRRLSLPVSSPANGASCYSSQSSIDMESPSATVPTKAAAIALHQLIECYRNGYRVTDHKIALMLDILDTQQRLAKVKLYWFFFLRGQHMKITYLILINLVWVDL